MVQTSAQVDPDNPAWGVRRLADMLGIDLPNVQKIIIVAETREFMRIYVQATSKEGALHFEPPDFKDAQIVIVGDAPLNSPGVSEGSHPSSAQARTPS